MRPNEETLLAMADYYEVDADELAQAMDDHPGVDPAELADALRQL